MAKQLNVNLAFSADTGKVKAQLQDLQNQLNKLTLSSKTELGITKDIEDASRAAAELSVHLKNATNQQTGTLDFSKLNQSIKQSGTSLQQYGRTLQSLGPQGQQAFMSLAQAVANSEVPIRRTNAMLKEMGTTLANTARWQLSSSMLHGFMGAVQSAYGYAQDLNESLNNIRIVTGQNIDQMAKFVEEANKAARALSTTTTEYTNASLIYYQQGLNDQQVKERTDITIKMANVARQGAEVVSDQMTAVWNNFYDGSKSLEHYADVMTALGAATASSTDEISEGLNKFAAVADTVGLSYEYAASALATVTATTRQSADVVGTAFKTLFARIQDLELGQTLDDGTTLGKYSEALNTVGINIKDVNGDMKSMDTILSELGNKWETLSKDTQVALAQTVAGTRQYTQLVALMDNWDYFQENLGVANTSSGALQEQADIYAESWEAAQDRVTAAAEKIYDSLLDDEFFIDVLNSIEKILVFVDDLIDNLGGLKGVLTAIGAIVTKVFSDQLAQGLTNMAYNMKMATETGRKEIQQAKSKFIDDAVGSVATIPKEATPLEEAQQESMRSQLTLQSEYLAKAEQMSVVEQETNKLLLDRVKTLRSQVVELESQREKHAQIVESLSEAIKMDVRGYNAANPEAELDTVKLDQYLNQMRTASDVLALLEVDGKKAFRAVTEGSENATTLMDTFKAKINGIDLSKMGAQGKVAFEGIKKRIDNLNPSSDSFEQDLKAINEELEELISKNSYILKDEYVSADVRKKVDNLAAGYRAKAQAQRQSAEATKQADEAERKALKTMDESKGAQAGLADGIVKMANVAFSAASAFNMLSSAIDTLSDPDISIWEKFTSVLMTLGMVIPTLMSVWKTLKSLQEMEIPVKVANAAATWAQVLAEKSLNKEKGDGNNKTRKSIKETIEDTKQKLANAKQKVSDSWNQSSWNKASDAQKDKYRSQVGSDTKDRYYREALQQNGYIEENGNFYQVDKDGKKLVTYRGKGKHKKAEINPIKKSDEGLKAAQFAAQKAAGKKVDADAAKLAGRAGGKALGTAAAGIAIVAASVIAAGTAIKLASDYYNRHEIAATKAAESAKRLAESYNEVKAAETEFRNNVSSYDNAVEGLDQLTKGTTAYKEAVMAANEQALELLKTNKDLSYTIDEETGLIEIDEEELEKAQEESLEKERLAQATSLSANQNAKNKQLEADMAKFNREQAKSGQDRFGADNTDEKTVAVGGGVAAGALGVGGTLLAAGAVNGWNPVGWVLLAAGALTAVVSTAIIAFGDEVQQGEEEALNAIAEKREELGRDLTKGEIEEIALTYDDTGELGKSLAGTTEALNNTNNMAEAINENTAAIRANTEIILAQEYGSATAEWLVDTYNDQYNQSRTELEQLNKDINRFEDIDEGSEATEMINRYMKATGKQLDWDYHVAAGTDENREFIYYETDEEGNKVEKRISATDMIEEIAVAEALKAQEDQAFAVNEMLNRIEADLGQGVATALASWTTSQSLSDDLSMNEFNEMQNDIASFGGAQGYLESVYGMSIDQMAEELGYSSGAKLLESFEQAIADKEQEFKDVSQMIPDAMQEEFAEFAKDNDAMGNLDAATQTNIASSLAEAYVTGGETGYNMMEKILGDATNSAEIKDLSAALNSLDWKEATPETLKEKLDELGIQTTLTTAELEALIDLMSDGVIRLTSIGETYTELVSAISDLSVTQEEYLQMSELGLGHYFTRMYDGTYQMIGAVEDFEQVLRELMQIEYASTLENANLRLKEIEAHQTETTSRLTALGLEDYDKISENISTKAVFDDYSNKVKMGDDGKATTTKHHDAIYEQESYVDWKNPFYYETETRAVMRSAAYDETVGVSDDLVQTYMDRIDYIEAMNIVSDEMIESWRTSTDMAKTEQEILNTYLPQAMEAHKNLASLDEIQKAAILEAEEALLSTAEDSEERKSLYESEGMHDQSYAKAVNAAITQESWEGLDQEEVSSYANYLEDYLGIAEEGAEESARAIAKMNKGVESLNSNWEEWGDILKNSEKSSQEYAKAMQSTRNALSDVLDVSEEFIRVDFISSAENMELIGKAAEGDAEAIDALGYALAEDIAKQAIELSDIITIDGIDYVGQAAIDKISSMMDGIQSEISGANLTIGDNLNTGPIFSKLQEVVAASQMTAEQANAFYRSMGFTPHFKMVDAVQAESVPVTTTYHNRTNVQTDADGNLISWVDTEYSETTQVPGGELHTALPSMTVETADGQMPQVPSTEIESVTYTGGGSFNNLSSSNKGGNKGSGGSSKKAEPTKKSDVVERYKEINDKLNDQKKAMDDASKAADRLWGPNRIKAMEDANKALEENIDLLKDKRAEAEYNLKQDKKDLQSTLSKEAGVSAQFDDQGNITNYNEIMNGLYAELQAEETAAGSEWSESEQEKIEGIQDRIDKVKEAISQYDETNQLIKDLDTEIQDAIYEWQDNNYEILNLELEYKVDINEKELEIVDYYLGKMEDDLYAYMEAMGQYNQQSAIYTDNLKNQETYVNDLTAAYNAGEISEQAYKEGLASSQSAIISNLQSLEESKQAMQDYYGNVMSMAIEEIGLYTAEMEQLNSVLDHYSNIMEIVGKQDDYATKGKILNSKANNIKNELAVQTELYKRSSAEAEDWAKKMSEAVVGSNEYETYKKNWQAAQQTANDAQDAMLSKTEEWAEAMKAVVENELADFAATMEESLTGGVSFDELLTSMERRSSLQEEYLTTTNKIYETNKLMRTAQQEIDKTSNTAAKRRLQNFINETNQLQNQTKLSNYELEIQQAKYDLLLAEIALEEAQNAKSTVRLSRDSEGNFGYVYTADSAAVSDAEQKLADAQNNLYNIGLEGANNYQQKYAETLQESQDAITELTQMWMNGEISSEEEFNRRKQEIVEYYGEKLQQYSELHSVALSADSRVVADAWSSDFTGMVATTGEWQAAVDGYFQSAAGSMETWAGVCATALENSKLNDLDGALQGIDEKSKALIMTLLGEDGESGLAGAMMDQVDAAGKISEQYTTLQNEIDTTITYFENLLTAVNNAYSAIRTPVSPAISTEGGTYNPDGSYNTSGGNNNNNNNNSGNNGNNSGNNNTGSQTKSAQVTFYASPGGGSMGQRTLYTNGFSIETFNYGSGFYKRKVTPNNGQAAGYVSENDYNKLMSLDTGGYTGEWGSYGKLALLHEKELVLNKQQTEDLFNAMDLLDQILQMIDLQSASAQLGGILSTPGFTSTTSNALEQQVHIEASFPGVSDRNEIEEAFNNLINKASQYANRK